jgi:hypothetical protein
MFKIIFVSLLVVPLFVSAHGDGLSLETEKEGYLVDIGYNSELVEGDTIRFDLELYKIGTKEPVAFTKAWARITRGEQVIFAGSISNATFGEPGLSLALMEEGEHSFFIRFEDKDEEAIVEASLPFNVAANTASERSASGRALPFAAGALLGLAGGFALRRKEK